MKTAHALRKIVVAGVACCGVLAQTQAQTPGLVHVTRESSEITLTWNCIPGRLYEIHATASPGAPWKPVVTQAQPLVATGYRLSWSTTVADAMQFYRIFERPAFTPSGMVWIQPGTFLMGSPSSELGPPNEHPQTTVTLTRGFWMGIHEVTQGEYESATGENWSFFNGNRTGATPGFGLEGRDYGVDLNRPVEYVSWDHAMNYCRLFSQWEREAGRLPDGWIYQLPTEAEWEYACRAGTTTRFSHGDDPDFAELDAYAWCWGSGVQMTSPVALKLPNPWGLYDMHGNVEEWCLDSIVKYPGGSVVDLKGAVGAGWVVRGGHWADSGSNSRSANRDARTPGGTYCHLGFRVVLAQDQP